MTQKSSGILLPISSLPSPFGIGTLGSEAAAFIDFLSASGQSWWQMLPVGPTSYGDSPYQSPSAFAGNPYLIDLSLLAREGLLTEEEISDCSWGKDPARTDYGALFENRLPLLRKAAGRGLKKDDSAFSSFQKKTSGWLEDYALYCALKVKNGMRPWTKWPREEKLRLPEALERLKAELSEEMCFYGYVQYLFFRQWDALKAYAADREIRIIGDLPLYLAMDSADVWAHPELFELDEEGFPDEVAGVPPDSFNANGQLWGNPLYRYDVMERDGFSWWIERIRGACRLYDAIRIDHFRGLESYWAVPSGSDSAKNGRWVKGPGMKLIGRLKTCFPQTLFIAEDLGYPTPEVRALLGASGFPGMKVLQFSFDSNDTETLLPDDYPAFCVCYSGTHDNNTLSGWAVSADLSDLVAARHWADRHGAADLPLPSALLSCGMQTPCELYIVQMQDWLGLGSEARMNTPGIPEGNWRWRMAPDALSPELAEKIRELTKRAGRC